MSLALLVLPLAACGSSDSKEGSGGKTTTLATPKTATQAAPETTAGGCRQVDQPQPKPDGGAKKPGQKLDPAKTWTLDFKTNCGNFTVQLDLKAGPNASASLVALARSGFFEGTVFHRIVPGFVIQGGDPTASGTGGPGYSTVDKPPADARYTKGVVAMAKAPTEAPGTAGSQFYVVTGPDIGLPPEYAVVGKVTKGLDVVERIGQLGNQSEQPTEVVAIESVAAKGS
jgi:cyclophilin family peptidyl-prolyl cis-trans isomerase